MGVALLLYVFVMFLKEKMVLAETRKLGLYLLVLSINTLKIKWPNIFKLFNYFVILFQLNEEFNLKKVTNSAS